jgi:hypothetical protein
MNPVRRFLFLACALALVALPCRAAEPGAPVSGQTVYVPVYSHILHGNLDSKGRPGSLPLSAMLSIRNTDAHGSLTVRSVRYVDTEGRPIRELVAQPRSLSPMASMELFVENKDMAGGSGANFVVVWDAAQPVDAPVIETIHSYFFGSLSAVFVSPGKPIRP